MIRVVLDTNVLASGFVRPVSTPGEVLRRCRKPTLLLVTAEPILSELERTRRKPYFASVINHRRRSRIIAYLRNRSLVVAPVSIHTPVATHPEDDLILATAVAGNAEYLVTGDRQLLALGTYEGVRIVSAAEFLAVLEADERAQEPHGNSVS